MSRPIPQPPIYAAPVPFNLAPLTASRTFKSSKLAPAPPTTSDGPSSPTTNSFYLESESVKTSSRPASGRQHKSQSSARNRPAGRQRHSHAGLSSSPTSLSTIHQNVRIAQARAARPSKSTRDLSLGEAANPFEPGAYEGGGMRNGEWEEWTDVEVLGLELEAKKERRAWRARYLGGAPSSEGDLQEEPDRIDEEPEEEEPPLDLLYDELDDPLLSLSADISAPRLPSLASDPGDSSSSAAGDIQMDLDDDSGDSQTLAESLPAPTAESIAMFEHSLSETVCPSCRVLSGCIKSDDLGGAKCEACGWGIGPDILRPLSVAFAAHHRHRPRDHAPLFSFTPFTGTIVLCAGCDEEFAA